jgi:hypothetical protein
MLVNAWITVTVLAVITVFFTITRRIDGVIGGFASFGLGALSAYGALSLSAVEGGSEKLVSSPELAIIGLAIIVIGVVYLFDDVVSSLDLGRLRGSR